MYQVFQEYYSSPLFEGSKKECRKFLQAKASMACGRLRKIVGYNWDDERDVVCWCTQTDRTFEVKKV